MASYYLAGYTTPQGVNGRSDVREWQNRLGVEADGIWGPKTQAAYEKYYQSNNTATTFRNMYESILGALSAPTISIDMPAKEELAKDAASYLRPAVDIAIENRQLKSEADKAELDADAASRGMGASTFVTSMKARENARAANDIALMEAQYTATLAKTITDELYRYQSLNLQAQMQNAQNSIKASTGALGIAQSLMGAYMQNAVPVGAKTYSGGNSAAAKVPDQSSPNGIDYVDFVKGLDKAQRALLYTSPAAQWGQMREELKIALGERGYDRLKALYPASAGGKVDERGAIWSAAMK